MDEWLDNATLTKYFGVMFLGSCMNPSLVILLCILTMMVKNKEYLVQFLQSIQSFQLTQNQQSGQTGQYGQFIMNNTIWQSVSRITQPYIDKIKNVIY